jgi:hypothetical protein
LLVYSLDIQFVLPKRKMPKARKWKGIGYACPHCNSEYVKNQYIWQTHHANGKCKKKRPSESAERISPDDNAPSGAPHHLMVTSENTFSDDQSIILGTSSHQRHFSYIPSPAQGPCEMLGEPREPESAKPPPVTATPITIVDGDVELSSEDESGDDNYYDGAFRDMGDADVEYDDASREFSDFGSDMEDEDERLFPGAETAGNYTTEEINLWLQDFKWKSGISDRHFDEMLKVLHRGLPDGHNFPRTQYMVERGLQADDGWNYSIHHCKKGCRCFDKITKSEWIQHKDDICGVEGCQERRFVVSMVGDIVKNIKPRAYFFYFGVEMAIRDMYMSTDIARLRAWKKTREQNDIWSGCLVQDFMNPRADGHLLKEEPVTTEFEGAEEVACKRLGSLIDIGYDGAQLYQNKVYNVGFLAMRSWDVPFWHRGKKDYTRLLALFPGPKEPNYEEMRDIFLTPFVTEMKRLAVDGIKKIFDPYLKEEYDLKVYLGTCSADTPARALMSGTNKQGSYHSDPKSIMQAQRFKEFGSQYYCGYSTPAYQDRGVLEGLLKAAGKHITNAEAVADDFDNGHAYVYAMNEKLFLNHDECMAIHEAVKRGEITTEYSGRKADPPLALCETFNICHGHVIPWVHAGLYGICKDFFTKCVFCDVKKFKKQPVPHYVMYNKTGRMGRKWREEFSELGTFLVLPSDAGRHYKDITQYAKSYVMEDWALFVEVSPMFHDLMYEWNPFMCECWLHLRAALFHYFASHGLYEDMPERDRHRHMQLARQNLYKYAERVEEYIGPNMCTTKLSALTRHGYEQERQTGLAIHSNEYWLERLIGVHKRVLRGSVVRDPELAMANRYLKHCARAACLTRRRHASRRPVRDLSKIGDESGGEGEVVRGPDMRDTAALEGHFLDAGHPLVLKEFDGKADLLHLAKQLEPALCDVPEEQIVLSSFKRANRFGEDFHSAEYMRVLSRCSHHVRFHFPRDDTPEGQKQFGKVQRYLLLTHANIRVHICELWQHITTTDGVARFRQYETVQERDPMKIYIPLEAIRHKVMFTSPPKMQDIGAFKVIPLNSTGRIIADKK